MIQGVISRMSGFSATAKNFAVTAAVAVVAIAFDKEAPPLLWAGIAATALFLLMDGYYHLLEVRFRELYRVTAERPIDAGSDMLLDAPAATSANVWKMIKSPTLLPFYVLLLFALLIALKEAPHVPAAKIDAKPLAARDTASDATQIPAAPTQRAGGPVRHSAEADTGKRTVGAAVQADNAVASAKGVGSVR
jgi:hypothetical protein